MGNDTKIRPRRPAVATQPVDDDNGGWAPPCRDRRRRPSDPDDDDIAEEEKAAAIVVAAAVVAASDTTDDREDDASENIASSAERRDIFMGDSVFRPPDRRRGGRGAVNDVMLCVHACTAPIESFVKNITGSNV